MYKLGQFINTWRKYLYLYLYTHIPYVKYLSLEIGGKIIYLKLVKMVILLQSH